MKGEMNAFDIMAISGEMQALVGGFVDKVFNWDKRNVLFRINTQQGKRELYFKGTKWLFAPESKPEAPTPLPASPSTHARCSATAGSCPLSSGSSTVSWS